MRPIGALDAKRVVRDAHSVRAEPGQHLFLLIQGAGHSRAGQGGRWAELGPGDMFLQPCPRSLRIR
jgi:hypothetical protein